MPTCCDLVHPAAAHEVDTAPSVAVLDGVAVPLTGAPPASRGDLVTGALLAWFAGLLTTAAVVTVLAVNVPLVELAELLLAGA